MSKQKWLFDTARAKGGEIKAHSPKLLELLEQGYEPFSVVSVHEPTFAGVEGTSPNDWHEARDVVVVSLRKRVEE
jgi:hypothetical protein